MDPLTNEEFIKFLCSFKDEYYCPVTEISRAKTGNKQPLIHSEFKMLSFDDMCRKYDLIKKHLPKTMDAIHFEVDENDKLTLYLIEFKNFSMTDRYSTYQEIEALHRSLKKKNKKTVDPESEEKIISNTFLRKFENVKKHFVDSIEFDLRMKPLESILVSLPWLYDEYCNNNEDIDKKDIRKFLNNADIKLIVFINRYAPRNNVSADRLSAHSIDNALKSQYLRLSYSGVIVRGQERILSRDRFDYFIKKGRINRNFLNLFIWMFFSVILSRNYRNIYC